MNSDQISPSSSTKSGSVLYSSSPPSNSLPSTSTSPDQSFSPSFLISARNLICKEDVHSKAPKNSFAIQELLGLSENVTKTQEMKEIPATKHGMYQASSISFVSHPF